MDDDARPLVAKSFAELLALYFAARFAPCEDSTHDRRIPGALATPRMRPLPLVLSLLLACAPACATVVESVATGEAAGREGGARIAPADAVARTRAFFGALDHRDIEALDVTLAAGVVVVDRGRAFDREFLLEAVRTRAARNASERAPVCDEGVVRSMDNVAVVVAECSETTRHWQAVSVSMWHMDDQ